MTERVFYCADLTPPTVTLDEIETQHARASLRLPAGTSITLIDGRGGVARGRFLAATGGRRDREGIAVEIDVVRRLARPAGRLTLIVAQPKGDRLNWLVEKCTELGVDRIIFTNFARSVVTAGEAKLDRLDRIVRAAAKQSRRAWFPEIAAAESPVAAVTDAAREDALALVADPTADAASLLESVQRSSVDRSVAVLIGPEGGLTQQEVQGAVGAGATAVRLGATILRVETAAAFTAAIWSAARPTQPIVELS